MSRDIERGESSGFSRGGPVTRSASKLLKCFCDCTFYSREEIQQALSANVGEILRRKNFRKLFRGFLIKYTGNIKSKAETDFECFLLCEQLLNGEGAVMDDDEVRDTLQEYCFTEEWEERLIEALDSVGNFQLPLPEVFQFFLHSMMRQCELRIGNYPEFHLFREKLKNKLR